jgi:hypothetical protein
LWILSAAEVILCHTSPPFLELAPWLQKWSTVAPTKEPENEVWALLYRHFQLETKEIHISSGTRTPGKSGEQAQGDVEMGDGHGTEKPPLELGPNQVCDSARQLELSLERDKGTGAPFKDTQGSFGTMEH